MVASVNVVAVPFKDLVTDFARGKGCPVGQVDPITS